MFKPWVSIPTEDVIVTVDYDYGDVRLMFKDVKVIDNVIEQLTNLRELTEEMEGAK